MAHKHKKYRETFTHDGIRYDIEADSQVELDSAVAVKKYELENSLVEEEPQKITLGTWIDKYLEKEVKPYATTRRYEAIVTYANRVKSDTGDNPLNKGALPLSKVTRWDCQDILNRMDGLTEDYIRKVANFMRNSFDAAVDQKYLKGNPMPNKIKMPKHAVKDEERRPATEAELKDVYDAAARLGQRYENYIILLHRLGVRPSEAGRTVPSHFNIDMQSFHVVGTKSDNATRDIPFPADLIPWVEGIRKENPLGLLVTNIKGGATSRSVRDSMWNKIREDIKENKKPFALAEDLTAGCIRHNYASERIAEGIPRDVVARLMGHKDSKVTGRYIGFTEEMFNDTKAKMDAKKRQGGSRNEFATVSGR